MRPGTSRVRRRVRRLLAPLALLLLLTALPGPAGAAPAPVGAGQHADVPAAAQTLEAEDGALDGVTAGSAHAGFTGKGYVEGFDAESDSVVLTVPDGPGGLYELTVRYSSPHGPKKAQLLLNGEAAGEVSLAENADWADAGAGRVLLGEGTNTLTIRSGWGYYEIDSVTLTPASEQPPHQVTGELTDPQATPEASSLMRYLADGYGENVLSGQQETKPCTEGQSTSCVEWLEENTGKAPAAAGFDLMDYSPSRVERGTTSTAVEDALAWDGRGGITTMLWHWNAPSGLIDEPGKEWYRGFYTDATTFDVAKAIDEPGSADHELLLRDIDAIAVQLGRLQDAGVPVLWRPLHEAEGGWFWWGAKGPEPVKKLWRLMYERLTGEHGLHNLIWVWNSVDPEWYPGDDVVDVVSYDSYPAAGDHGPVSGPYQQLVELGADRKLVALTENGSIPDPDQLAAYRADWRWFMTWAGEFLTDGSHNSREFLQQVYDHEYVITLDELGDFKHHP